MADEPESPESLGLAALVFTAVGFLFFGVGIYGVVTPQEHPTALECDRASEHVRCVVQWRVEDDAAPFETVLHRVSAARYLPGNEDRGSMFEIDHGGGTLQLNLSSSKRKVAAQQQLSTFLTSGSSKHVLIQIDTVSAARENWKLGAALGLLFIAVGVVAFIQRWRQR